MSSSVVWCCHQSESVVWEWVESRGVLYNLLYVCVVVGNLLWQGQASTERERWKETDILCTSVMSYEWEVQSVLPSCSKTKTCSRNTVYRNSKLDFSPTHCSLNGYCHILQCLQNWGRSIFRSLTPSSERETRPSHTEEIQQKTGQSARIWKQSTEWECDVTFPPSALHLYNSILCYW